jgi:hypothetical protein
MAEIARLFDHCFGQVAAILGKVQIVQAVSQPDSIVTRGIFSILQAWQMRLRTDKARKNLRLLLT